MYRNVARILSRKDTNNITQLIDGNVKVLKTMS